MADAERPDEIDSLISQCTCKVDKKDFNISVTDTHISWQKTSSKQEKDLNSVRFADILGIKLQSSTNIDCNLDSLHIRFVKQGKKLYLKIYSVIFTFSDIQEVKNLHQDIINQLENVSHRPKKLLVLINPISGRSKGQVIYRKTVAPIFEEAGITTNVIVTEKAHHTEEIIETYDINSIDGLVVVGGDGIYHEAVNGLLSKLIKEQGLNVDNPDEVLPEIPIRIGLVPCGTGNGIAALCNGNYDVQTAALSIAIGHEMQNNVISVHSGGRHIAFSVLLLGYGIWGDIIHTAESRRSQGIMRYPTSVLQHIFIRPFRRFTCTITALSPGKSTNKVEEPHENMYDNNTVFMDQTIDTLNVTDQGSPVTRTINELVIGASIFSSIVPNVETDIHMIVNKPIGTWKFITFMTKLVLLKFDELQHREDIIHLPGYEWSVKLNNPSPEESQNGQMEHIMNIDGEVFKIPQTEFRAKILPQKVRLFSNLPFATKRILQDST